MFDIILSSTVDVSKILAVSICVLFFIGCLYIGLFYIIDFLYDRYGFIVTSIAMLIIVFVVAVILVTIGKVVGA